MLLFLYLGVIEDDSPAIEDELPKNGGEHYKLIYSRSH